MIVGGSDVGVGTGVSVITVVATGVGVSSKGRAVGCKIAVAANSVGSAVVPSETTAVGITNSVVWLGSSPPQATSIKISIQPISP
jgi:hypothetical protein